MSVKEIIQFPGGLTTDPELKKLKEAFPDIDRNRGSIITHESIAGIIGYRHPSNRYKTITGRWRKWAKRYKGLIIRGDTTEAIGVGFYILTAAEQVESEGIRRSMKAMRQTVRGFESVASAPDELLTETQRKHRDMQMIEFGKIRQIQLQAERNITAFRLGVPEVRPQIQAPANIESS